MTLYLEYIIFVMSFNSMNMHGNLTVYFYELVACIFTKLSISLF